jgi:5'-3' exonuclease
MVRRKRRFIQKMIRRNSMEKQKKFSTLDVYLSAFLSLHGLTPSLERKGGRVTFNFPATDALYRIMSDYNSNEVTPVADFVTRVKTLRGQMLTMREA